MRSWVGIDHLKHQFARIHDLPGNCGAGCDDAADWGLQYVPAGEAPAQGAGAFGQAVHFAFGCFDLLAGHGLRQLAQPGQALLRERLARTQLGNLGHLA